MVAADGETGRGLDKQTVYLCSIWKKRNKRPMLEVSSNNLGVGTVLSL